MTRRISHLAASAAVLLLVLPPGAIAASIAETHAFLEAERTRTDGQPVPADPRQASRDSASADARPATAAERHFLFQLSRTDGSSQTQPDEARTDRATLGDIAQARRARKLN